MPNEPKDSSHAAILAMATLSLLLAGCESGKSPITPTVGGRCTNTIISGDETYLADDLTCVEMHKATRHDELNGWTYAYVVGTRAEALFRDEEDAKEWARSQPYVRRPSQKH